MIGKVEARGIVLVGYREETGTLIIIEISLYAIKLGSFSWLDILIVGGMIISQDLCLQERSLVCLCKVNCVCA